MLAGGLQGSFGQSLRVFDLTNPASPTEVGNPTAPIVIGSSPGRAEDVTLHGGLAYLALGDSGVLVIAPPLFGDGFESGDLARWSRTIPTR